MDNHSCDWKPINTNLNLKSKLDDLFEFSRAFALLYYG